MVPSKDASFLPILGAWPLENCSSDDLFLLCIFDMFLMIFLVTLG